MNLNESCRLPIGTRDAVHVPVVVAIYDRKNRYTELFPGMYVKFTDDKCTQFVPCESHEADGIINPFLTDVCCYTSVVVFLTPGITTPVRHNFDIDRKMKQVREEALKHQLEEAKREDPACAECYAIENNEVIRY